MRVLVIERRNGSILVLPGWTLEHDGASLIASGDNRQRIVLPIQTVDHVTVADGVSVRTNGERSVIWQSDELRASRR